MNRFTVTSIWLANSILGLSLIVSLWAYVFVSRREGSYFNVLTPTYLVAIPSYYLLPLFFNLIFVAEATTCASYLYATLAVQNVAFAYVYTRPANRLIRLPFLYSFNNYAGLAFFFVTIAVLLYVPVLFQFPEYLLNRFPVPYGKLTLELQLIGHIPRAIMPSKPKSYDALSLDDEFFPHSVDEDGGSPDFGIGVQYADFGIFAIFYLAFFETIRDLDGGDLQSAPRSLTPSFRIFPLGTCREYSTHTPWRYRLVAAGSFGDREVRASRFRYWRNKTLPRTHPLDQARPGCSIACNALNRK